ncbi:hypothetical protein CR513_20156, partial [Mucuna pruriens]
MKKTGLPIAMTLGASRHKRLFIKISKVGFIYHENNAKIWCSFLKHRYTFTSMASTVLLPKIHARTSSMLKVMKAMAIPYHNFTIKRFGD